MGPYVVVDVETTGVDPGRDRIIQIALRRSDGATWSSFVNPGRSIPESILALTHFSGIDFAHSPPFSALRSEVAEWLSGARVVGHNIGFDAAFLRAEGILLPHPLDTLRWSRLAFPQRTQHALADWFPEEAEWLHDARHDAWLTERLLHRIYERCCEMSRPLKQDLARLLGDEWAWWQADSASEGQRESPLYHPAPDLFHAEPLLATPVGEDAETHLNRLGQRRPGRFEHRPGQITMLHAVDEALHDGRFLMVEAGTGTGKSFAYLIPSLLKALTSGERVVVATHTVALQDQLWEKDLPEAQAGLPVKSALLKGRGRYVCLYKVQELVESSAVLAETRERREAMAVLLSFLEETEDGDLDHLPPLDEAARALWQEMAADQQSCAGARCPYAGPCFMRRARHAAESSHVVVVNHALLAAEMLRGGVLPPFSHLVLDEAHHWADVVEEQCGFTLEGEQWNRRFEEMMHPRRGLAASLQKDVEDRALLEALRDRYRTATDALAGWADALVAMTPASDYDRRAVRVTSLTLERFHEQGVNVLQDAVVSLLSEVLAAGRDALQQAERAGLQDEPRWLRFRQWLEDMAGVREGLRLWGTEDADHVSWWEVATTRQGVPTVSWRWAPVDIRQIVREKLWSTLKSAILTSATLTVRGAFDYVADRLGLPQEERAALVVPSPFDWPAQACLVIPEQGLHPDDPGYSDMLAEVVYQAAFQRGGRTLVLLTSYRAVERLAWRVRDRLAQVGLRTLAQNVDGSARRLVAEFRRRPASVLIGTATFWEGVDLPGDDLEIVIMGRLPFRAPGDPLEEAKCERLQSAGLSPFYHRSLPEAVLRFQQGFGRLIRTTRDRGMVIVLDPRIHPKRSRYARIFLESLPEVPVRVVPLREMAQAIEAFWGGFYAHSSKQ
ncbi:MAG: exonuclease domain-containing protein [Firmicutes bacterium]|nr:exonuclease domain-containing protein [Bacillota bacterium]